MNLKRTFFANRYKLTKFNSANTKTHLKCSFGTSITWFPPLVVGLFLCSFGKGTSNKVLLVSRYEDVLVDSAGQLLSRNQTPVSNSSTVNTRKVCVQMDSSVFLVRLLFHHRMQIVRSFRQERAWSQTHQPQKITCRRKPSKHTAKHAALLLHCFLAPTLVLQQLCPCLPVVETTRRWPWLVQLSHQLLPLAKTLRVRRIYLAHFSSSNVHENGNAHSHSQSWYSQNWHLFQTVTRMLRIKSVWSIQTFAVHKLLQDQRGMLWILVRSKILPFGKNFPGPTFQPK